MRDLFSSLPLFFNTDSEVSRSAEFILRNLFWILWSLCAGWNRRPFRERHIDYIIRKNGVRVTLAPLGKLDAITTIIGNQRFIGLNRTVFTGAGRRTTEEEVWNVVSQNLAAKERFVLLHEIAHVYLHGDHKDFWQETPWKKERKGRWIAESGLLLPKKNLDGDLAPATIREIEADFYALLALIPDFILWRMAQNNRLHENSVLKYLCSHNQNDPTCDCESLRDLARYRIEIFKKFAHMFQAISSESFETISKGSFRKTETIEGVDAEKIRQLNGASENESIQQILTLHPRVKNDQTLRETVMSFGQPPFSTVTCSFA